MFFWQMNQRQQLVMELAVIGSSATVDDKTELRTLRRFAKTGIKTNGNVVAAANNIMATTLKVTPVHI